MSKVKRTGNKVITRRLLKLKDEMTLRAFADRCGINQNTMHNYLHGRRLDESVINKICDAFGKSSDWLLGRREETPAEVASQNFNILANQVKAHSKSMKELLSDLGVK
jgi:transcriptional regulator with XRE-family HTH domain